MILSILVCLMVALAGCGQPAASVAQASHSQTITVSAAASLVEAFGEIGQEFQAAHPEGQVVFTFAGSQQLAQQIDQGAPADVFASANDQQMQVAIQGGRILTGSRRTFARNRLVVITPKNDSRVTRLQDLGKPGLRLVLAARQVPAGQYTLDFLARASLTPAFGSGFQDDVLKNVVSYEDNVRAVLTKVVLGEADAGVVYATDISGDSAGKVSRTDIPDELNTVAQYSIATLQDSAHPDLAQAFIDQVMSPQGQAILTRYNFIPAANEP